MQRVSDEQVRLTRLANDLVACRAVLDMAEKALRAYGQPHDMINTPNGTHHSDDCGPCGLRRDALAAIAEVRKAR